MNGLRVLQAVEATTAGVGRHVLDLSSAMLQAGLEVRVACPAVRDGARQDSALVGRLQAAGVPVHLLPMRRAIHPAADLRAAGLLLGLIREFKPDVVHAHSSKAGVLGRWAALFARRGGSRPVIVYTPNAFAFSGARSRPARQFLRGIERWLGHHATDALVCVSRSEWDQARRHVVAPPGRLKLIENAVDVLRFAELADPGSARAALGLAPDRPVVGFVGRLTRQKGAITFVDAALRVLDADREAQFLLVGEGEQERGLSARVREAGRERSVILAGYRSDIPAVMAALDLFVLPSLYEGLPYTLMEAMAAGRPVIASRVGGNCDLIVDGETGVLVPPGDPSALAERVIHLLAQPYVREQLGARAQAAARARPSPEEMARRVMDLYRDLLERETADVKTLD